MKRRLRIRFFSNRLLTAPFKIQMLALLLFAVALIISGSLILTIWGLNFLESAWWVFLRVSNFSILDQADALPNRVIGVVLSISGWIIFGLFISIVASGFQQQLQILKKGTGGANLKHHTIIFGWNETLPSIVIEATSKENDDGSDLLIMSDRTAEEMAYDINLFCGPKALRKLILRYGTPESVEDQKRANAPLAKKIIILNNLENKTPFESDAAVMKTTMALGKNIEQNQKGPLDQNIILDILQPTSISLMRGILPEFNEKSKLSVIPVLTQRVIGRVIAQCALQPGLSEIYQDLFSYKDIEGLEGNFEVYSLTLQEAGIDEPMVFEELLEFFPDIILIGYISDGNRRAVVSPPWGSPEAEYKINPQHDRLLLFAESSQQVFCRNDNDYKVEVSVPACRPTSIFESMSVIVYGTGFKAMVVVQGLLEHLPPGSRITCTQQLKEKLAKANLKDTSGIGISYVDMEEIENLLTLTSLAEISDFDIIIMAQDLQRAQDHDTLSLMLLSGLNASCEDNYKRPRVVMELLNPNNAELARSAKADDVIIATELASTFLYNISCDTDRYILFNELLSSEGPTIYFKPLCCYVETDKPFTFYQVKAVARRRNEIAIGYSYIDNHKLKWVFGPPNNTMERKIDKIIVLADDGTM